MYRNVSNCGIIFIYFHFASKSLMCYQYYSFNEMLMLLLPVVVLVNSSCFQFSFEEAIPRTRTRRQRNGKVNENTSSVNFVLKFHLITNILKIEAIGHFSCSFVRRQNQRSKDMKCKCTQVVYIVN